MHRHQPDTASPPKRGTETTLGPLSTLQPFPGSCCGPTQNPGVGGTLHGWSYLPVCVHSREEDIRILLGSEGAVRDRDILPPLITPTNPPHTQLMKSPDITSTHSPGQCWLQGNMMPTCVHIHAHLQYPQTCACTAFKCAQTHRCALVCMCNICTHTHTSSHQTRTHGHPCMCINTRTHLHTCMH